jgi:VHL beta domain
MRVWWRSLARGEQVALIGVGATILVGLLGAIPAYLVLFADNSDSAPTTSTLSTVSITATTALEEPTTTIETVQLQALDCGRAGSIRAETEEDASEIEIVNETSAALVVYWINHDGAKERYGALKPGQSQAFETYRTHPWMITSDSGRCIAVFLPDSRPGRAVVQE